jgi:pimeloyl-ACP methyl ester carboxylesterase
MPFATNAIDGCKVYFEDDGGAGPPVIFLNGLGDPIAASRRWGVSTALAADHRCIYVDQRGHGLSDKPHRPAAYTTSVRVADVVAVLDALEMERSHIIGTSWGARLAFGLGDLAPKRALSLTMGGQSPYAMNPEGTLVKTVTRAFSSGHDMADFLRALGASPDVNRLEHAEVLDNDFDALAIAWEAAMAEGDVASNLSRWDLPCLIYAGSEDADFFEDARRAATEIPRARFLALQNLSHLAAHENVDDVLPHIRALINS